MKEPYYLEVHQFVKYSHLGTGEAVSHTWMGFLYLLKDMGEGRREKVSVGHVERKSLEQIEIHFQNIFLLKGRECLFPDQTLERYHSGILWRDPEDKCAERFCDKGTLKMSEHKYTPDPSGLYKKYNIYRRNPDGTNGDEVTGPTFTLRPYDPHAAVALRAYADSVQSENNSLATDLRLMAAGVSTGA